MACDHRFPHPSAVHPLLKGDPECLRCGLPKSVATKEKK